MTRNVRTALAVASLALVAVTVALLTGLGGCGEPGGATVTIKGRTIAVQYSNKGPWRAEAVVRRAKLADNRGVLVGWAHDRIQHYWTWAGDPAYEVLILAADGRILERHALGAGGSSDVTSKAEARYALLLAENWSYRNDASDADRVEFDATIREKPPEPLPEIKLGDKKARVEVMDTDARRARGMMHRRGMSPEDGMIFVFPRERDDHGFWMLNCHVPLDIAYFDAQGRFVNLVSMDTYEKPGIDTGARARVTGRAQFVVEMRKGWFQENGLVDKDGKAIGDLRLEMPAEVRALVKS